VFQNMDKYIDRFPQQLLEAVEIGLTASDFKLQNPLHHIVISGMGGSGIGGLLIKDLLKQRLKTPIEVINDYTLPLHCGENTLVICSSYSGNTEETLATFDQALRKKCMIACVTTGGKLLEKAVKNNLPHIVIPGGMPPRSCLGYSTVAQLFVLKCAGIINDYFIEEIKDAAHLLINKRDDIQLSAKTLADQLQQSIPIIYGDVAIQAVVLRWKQQINENAKMHCFCHVIPEMNHNELVAYYKKNTAIAAVFIRHPNEYPQTARRFELVKELINDKVSCTVAVSSEGNHAIENMFYLIHLGDWMSFYLSVLKGVDPIKIDMLDWLKTALEKK
jgi:glucose/mannose-6-phosphate isomerase